MKKFESITLASILENLRFSVNLDPARDWIIMLSVSVMLLAGVIVWDIWVFNTIADGGAVGGATAMPTSPLSATTLDTVKKVFGVRASEQDKYLSGAYRFSDPSQ